MKRLDQSRGMIGGIVVMRKLGGDLELRSYGYSRRDESSSLSIKIEIKGGVEFCNLLCTRDLTALGE